MFHKRNIIIFFTAFLLSACAVSSNFQQEMIGLTPGSNAFELNFAWYSNDGSQTLVHIFDESNEIVIKENGFSGNASKGKFFHKAVVKGLKPNTQYKYSVSGDGTNWSDKYDYKTPKPGTFRFAAVGDPQLINDLGFEGSTAEGWKKTVTRIAAHNVNFIAGAGDQVDNGGDESEYAIFFAPPQLRNIPYAPVMGNHDVNDLFTYHFNLPNSSGGSLEEQGNYWYLYNNVLFVVLNTSPWPGSKQAAESFIRRFDAVFNAAKSENVGKYNWIIVQHHRSTRSAARHSVEDESIKHYKEAGFEDLMAKHDVSLVLAGHDHVYARSNPINGVIYITLNSSSGTKYYDTVESVDGDIKVHFQNNKPGYAIFDVKGDAITAEVYEAEGDTVVDGFSILP
jgi:hypothetical protein